ncbi:RNA polymerase sigma factor [Tautonia plasticadhaerens]|uniref:RNA polymerase sigma factor n=1 Tax=Tautonia plasticadhaerens TaxID=2527974 RepID=A0A518H544_9BACT|nr:hypothetical protein [Tautonia plasticadhaerens]QDV35964.1 hypothetical protein ElP_38740 [Tautonia plasticadhaerens]
MDEDRIEAYRPPRRFIRREGRDRDPRVGDRTAWERVIRRHEPAALRYLRDAVGDPAKAEALFREFAGAMRLGDRDGGPIPLGPFRDLLRTPLVRLVEAHRGWTDQANLIGSGAGADEASSRDAEEARFDAIWRQELLDRSWSRLREMEDRTGQPFHTTLKCLADAPGLSSPELADRVGRKLGKAISAPNARQLLHRARAEFSKLLLEEVVATLPCGAPFEAIERELIETGLLAFCREAVGRARPVSWRGR